MKQASIKTTIFPLQNYALSENAYMKKFELAVKLLQEMESDLRTKKNGVVKIKNTR